MSDEEIKKWWKSKGYEKKVRTWLRKQPKDFVGDVCRRLSPEHSVPAVLLATPIQIARAVYEVQK